MSKQTKEQVLNEQFETLNTLVEEINSDKVKFVEKGNKAAGTRVRTGASSITKLLKEIRKSVSEIKEEREADKK